MTKKQTTEHSLLISGVLLLLPLGLLYYLNCNRQPEIKEEVLGQSLTNPLDQEAVSWQDYLDQHPNYFPGWLELAKIKYEANDLEGLRLALDKAQQLNPNSAELERLLLLSEPLE